MLDWMRELLGLPDRFRSTSATGGGVIQGSASEATLVAILAARWRATGGDVNTDGDTSRARRLQHRRRPTPASRRVCASPASAPSRSASSPTTRRSRCGPTRSPQRWSPPTRRRARAVLGLRHRAAPRPRWRSTRRRRSATICRDERVWLHVDAAMSGIAALAPELRWINDGLELADSYCTNPHKWMGVNFDCDLFCTADRRPLLGALSILPEYLRSEAAEAGAAIDYRDWQIPLGRRFRALKLWFAHPLRRRRGVPDDDPPPRRADPAAGRRGRATDDRFEIVAPHPLNLLCVALRRRRRGDRRADRAGQRHRPSPVHPHGARRSRRCCASRSAAARPSSATSTDGLATARRDLAS